MTKANFKNTEAKIENTLELMKNKGLNILNATAEYLVDNPGDLAVAVKVLEKAVLQVKEALNVAIEYHQDLIKEAMEIASEEVKLDD